MDRKDTAMTIGRAPAEDMAPVELAKELDRAQAELAALDRGWGRPAQAVAGEPAARCGSRSARAYPKGKG